MPRRKGIVEGSSNTKNCLSSGKMGRPRKTSTSSRSKASNNNARRKTAQLSTLIDDHQQNNEPHAKRDKKKEMKAEEETFFRDELFSHESGKAGTSYDDVDDEDDEDVGSFIGEDGNLYQQRNAANARERARMRTLSTAFSSLKKTLPWVPPDTKLSKLDTLRLATSYIAHLRTVLSEDEDSDGDDENGSLESRRHVNSATVAKAGRPGGSSNKDAVTGDNKGRHSGIGIHPRTLTWPFMIQKTCSSPSDLVAPLKSAMTKNAHKVANVQHHSGPKQITAQRAVPQVMAERPSPPNNDHLLSPTSYQIKEDVDCMTATNVGFFDHHYNSAQHGGHQQLHHHAAAAYWTMNHGGHPFHQAEYDPSTGCPITNGAHNVGDLESDFFLAPYQRYSE